MRKPSREEIIHILLETQPLSFAHRLGIPIEDGSTVSLFRLLCISLLYASPATDAALLQAEELFIERDWTNPQFLYRSTFEERLNALETADVVIFDERERYARWLGELAGEMIFRYAGDLRALRQAARQDTQTERKLLHELKGMNDASVDFFSREVQVAWCEQFPFVNGAALAAALQLNIGESVEDLSRQVPALDFPRLALALEQVERSCSYEDIRRKASELRLAARS